MILVDYNYYSNTYKGTTIPQNSFYNMAIQASSKVNLFTYSRIKEESQITDDVRNATCKVAELLFNQENLKNKISQDSKTSGDIASESLGPHSITYVNKSTIQKEQVLSGNALDKECYLICYEYLIMTGLMDRRIYE